ncbi:hypothetical protein ILUMI_01966 [Ignelater luminosus]|uniref:Amidase domain-containing protein n=1 Tax=Ignelater luminosus TaxID=2038154 RepID=A0A8K0DDF2_IGNLU|nr:hypothetical protein ILUMI_01966 [Ignelater luminosus]
MSLFVDLVLFIRFYIDLFIDYLFSFYYESQRQYISKPQNPLIIESATSLAKKISEKQVTSEEVVRAFIERIKEVDGILNALVDSRFDEAIKEAKVIDKNIAEGKINTETFKEKPFLGVPFTTKESTACKGMKSTYGLICRKDATATEDADIVSLLKRSGGILLGVTNIPILNMWQETKNLVYGTTNNPYNSTRTVGGSSGGEASIIAACGSPFGIGNINLCQSSVSM